MYIGFQVKFPLFFPILTKRTSKDFRKILRHHISRIFVQCEPSCSMRTDRPAGGGQTDMTKLIIVAFHNFAKGPKYKLFLQCSHTEWTK